MCDYKTFRSFLQEQGCEAAFDRAFYQYNDFTPFDEVMWAAADAECIFGHAFNWRETPEGREYWSEIDKKWFNIIYKKQSYDTCNT